MLGRGKSDCTGIDRVCELTVTSDRSFSSQEQQKKQSASNSHYLTGSFALSDTLLETLGLQIT